MGSACLAPHSLPCVAAWCHLSLATTPASHNISPPGFIWRHGYIACCHSSVQIQASMSFLFSSNLVEEDVLVWSATFHGIHIILKNPFPGHVIVRHVCSDLVIKISLFFGVIQMKKCKTNFAANKTIV